MWMTFGKRTTNHASYVPNGYGNIRALLTTLFNSAISKQIPHWNTPRIRLMSWKKFNLCLLFISRSKCSRFLTVVGKKACGCCSKKLPLIILVATLVIVTYYIALIWACSWFSSEKKNENIILLTKEENESRLIFLWTISHRKRIQLFSIACGLSEKLQCLGSSD